MRSQALPEEALQTYLRRRRQGTGDVIPALGGWLTDSLELACRLVPAGAAWLWLDDPTRARPRRGPLTVVAAVGPRAAERIGRRARPGRGLDGAVYRTGATRTSTRTRPDPDVDPSVDPPEAASLIAVPLRLENARCGVLQLSVRARHRVGARDVELVELVAGYLSRGILNAVDMLKQSDLVHRDELTGVRNLRALEPELEGAIVAAPADQDVALLFIDIDRLKRINDRLGHRAGSEALRRTARALEAGLDARGSVYRFGGDEFVVLCPGMDAAEAERVANELRDRVAVHTAGSSDAGVLPGVSISVGVATLRTSLGAPPPRERPAPSRATRLLAAADKALYRAKRHGRGRSARATRRDDTLRMRAIRN